MYGAGRRLSGGCREDFDDATKAKMRYGWLSD